MGDPKVHIPSFIQTVPYKYLRNFSTYFKSTYNSDTCTFGSVDQITFEKLCHNKVVNIVMVQCLLSVSIRSVLLQGSSHIWV